MSLPIDLNDLPSEIKTLVKDKAQFSGLQQKFLENEKATFKPEPSLTITFEEMKKQVDDRFKLGCISEPKPISAYKLIPGTRMGMDW